MDRSRLLGAEVPDDGTLVGFAGVFLEQSMECDTGDVVLCGLEVEATTKFELEVLEPVELAVREEKGILAPGLLRDVEASDGFCCGFRQRTLRACGVEGDRRRTVLLGESFRVRWFG